MAFALSKNWLIDDYNINYSTSSLIDKLTPAGLEIDNVDKILELDNTFVVGEIISVKKHSKADKLSVCQVSIGNDELLQIVCGCSSVAQGLKVVVATVGSKMPNGLEIKSCKLRGEVSNGMLCSANELGLNEISEGILHLESDAKLGVRVSEYFLQREDDVLQVEITPNRGDCLSVLGLAREINSLHYIKDDIMSNFDVYNIKYNDLPIKLIADNGCEVYEAVKIDNLDLTQKTPRWILNRLSLFGQNSVNLFVDIVNYVMFELGQPMHGFAVDKVDGQIFINWANEEKVVLLDKSEILLNKEDLVICDESGVLALAGIMGSDRALVDSSTTSVILEAACFNSNIIARSCRKHVISSDSAYRFERGVDRNLTSLAIQRVISLLQVYTDCKVVSDVRIENDYEKKSIILKKTQVQSILGIDIEKEQVDKILTAIGCRYEYSDNWLVFPPTYRYDLNIPQDLIEEILRFIGFEKLGAKKESFSYMLHSRSANDDDHQLRYNMSKLGMHEHIGYSFVSADLQKNIFNLDESDGINLINPISNDMGQMRVSCWPGLLDAAKYNINRQCENVRLFELGNCFHNVADKVYEVSKLSGVLYGKTSPMQWGVESREIDFYDVKGVCESILHCARIFDYRLEVPKCSLSKSLHPGKSAAVYVNDEQIGIFGILHPKIKRKNKFLKTMALFEFDKNKVLPLSVEKTEEVSKFPSVRRDLSIVVDEGLSYNAIQEKIKSFESIYIKNVILFDVYRGGKIPDQKKSLALAIIFQSKNETLTDKIINDDLEKFLCYLKNGFSFVMREF